jgi:SAM-dependent methyltransferase
MGIARECSRALARLPRFRNRRCVMCGRLIGAFLPYRGGKSGLLMRELTIVGSDVRNFECPFCGAHDRERHLLLYMNASGLMDRICGMRILHFAPERQLPRHIAAKSPALYLKCDRFSVAGDMLRVDIEAMPFADLSFDLVIANHVMEHVSDDLRALREVRRVLAPGGMAILQTPYSNVLHSTWADDGIVTAAARREAFGQEDHVRLFGRDIFERFSSVGLLPCVETHAGLLPTCDPGIHGVNPDEPFFLFRRSR